MAKAAEPRKRPRQARSAATVDAILQAAAHILGGHGLAALNTNSVAELAGVSIGSLYQYFPSKDAILIEIIRRKREELLNGLTGALVDMDDEDFAQTLARLVDAAVLHQLAWPKLARTLDYAQAFLPLETETEALNASIIGAISRFLALHFIAEPDVAARDAVALARGIIDAAGLAGETDRKAVGDRVYRALYGYLRESAGERGM